MESLSPMIGLHLSSTTKNLQVLLLPIKLLHAFTQH